MSHPALADETSYGLLQYDRHYRENVLKYNVFKRVKHPWFEGRNDPGPWASLLEGGLPPHLRESSGDTTSIELNASEIAEVLLAAHQTGQVGLKFDLLYHLGVEKGRWRAVVWIVKQVVEKLTSSNSSTERLDQSLSSWASQVPLAEITGNAIDVDALEQPTLARRLTSPFTQSLEELTDDLKPEKLSREDRLRHSVLGTIWQSIGLMTITYADGGRQIRPEILEIIAYLHHKEIMPTSIYNEKPPSDSTAIQQPFTLNLFSSRILISLSDAAWRAHEKLVVEDAKNQGGEHVSLRPEIPGMAYRVNVAGLRPEVWLELILWSCLHGGWILEGATILQDAYSKRAAYNKGEPHQWTALSWRSLMEDSADDEHWAELAYTLNSSSPLTFDKMDDPGSFSTWRTVSSEVVNAYVDALISAVHLGVGERGLAPGTALSRLEMLHKLLSRSGLALETGSWDGVILRFFDAQDALVSRKRDFNRLMNLSPSVGTELRSNSTHKLPSYVLDGSALGIGLFHHALRSRIHDGDVHGAVRLFESLQQLADKNKHQSVQDFLRTQRLSSREDSDGAKDMFTNNFSGIEYPAFDVQVPATILGPFLELVLDAKAYDFCKWLLYSDEIDGPVILEEQYSDPAVAPALIRFATEMNDTKLLSKVIRTSSTSTQDSNAGQVSSPRLMMNSFFSSQVVLQRWESARRILVYMSEETDRRWSILSLSQLVRTMLCNVRGARAGGQSSIDNLSRSKQLMSDMVLGKYESYTTRPPSIRDQIRMLLTVLATLSPEWARFSISLQSLQGFSTFAISTRAFNLVLEGAVHAYGSVAGRRLLSTFWQYARPGEKRLNLREPDDEADGTAMTRYRPRVLDQPDRKRNVVQLPGRPSEEVVFYNGVMADLMTVQIIYRRAVEELRLESSTPSSIPQADSPVEATCWVVRGLHEVPEVSDLSPLGSIAWAVRCFRYLRMADEDIQEELDKSLSTEEMSRIRSKLPAPFNFAGRHGHNLVEDVSAITGSDAAFRPFDASE